jgi:hypothetical protein
MQRRRFLQTAGVLGLALLPAPALAQGSMLDAARGVLGGVLGGQGAPGGLTVGEIAAGLKEALRVGSGRVVDRVGASGGFNLDPAIRIPLPGPLQSVRDVLSRLGLSGMADDLQDRMNRAAEVASDKARPIFFGAIERMTLDDALAIYDGPSDAATRYFEREMTPPLTHEMRPVVDDALREAGAVRAYDSMIGRYRAVPFVPDVKADLSDHTVRGGLSGIFHYLAREEAAIRESPAARTTDILKRVFG